MPHPDDHNYFDKPSRRAISEAIGKRKPEKLIALLDAHSSDPSRIAAIAALLRIDDRLIFENANAQGEKERDAFLAALLAWANAAEQPALEAALARQIDQTGLIEQGYRLISQSIRDAPISARAPERQFAAVMHRTALDYDAIVAREVRFSGSDGQGMNYLGEITVTGDDGKPISVDSATASLADLVANCIGSLAYGRWPSDQRGYSAPLLVPPTEEEIAEAELLLLLSLSWNRSMRWEREARYWDGEIRVLRDADLPEDLREAQAEACWEHARGEGSLPDWIGVERLKQLQRQSLADFLIKRPIDYAGPEASRLPPVELVDVAERLAASLVFEGAHLDPNDGAHYGGATLSEWLRGYSTLRAIGNEALDGGTDALSRHLIRLQRPALAARLVAAGLSAEGAEAFIDGVTFRPRSIDLFDSPLIRQGPDDYVLLGLTVANIDAGRTLLSNLPNLGETLEHKGAAFEALVVSSLRSIGATIYHPDAMAGGERFQYDAILPWGSHLFVLECKNLAPSNLNPKAALDFDRTHKADVGQTLRLAQGLRAHPELLTDLGGPDPRRMTIVPVLLYAMPYARRGDERGVHTTDWSVVSRFFQRGDLGTETVFPAGDGPPVIHRQVTERVWKGDRPTPEDFLEAIRDPWAVRFTIARMRAQWIYASLAPYQLARSPDYGCENLTRDRIAAIYGIDLEAWERELDRAERKAARMRKAEQDRKLVLATRQARKRR